MQCSTNGAGFLRFVLPTTVSKIDFSVTVFTGMCEHSNNASIIFLLDGNIIGGMGQVKETDCITTKDGVNTIYCNFQVNRNIVRFFRRLCSK